MQPFGNVAQAVFLERDYFVDPGSDCRLRYAGCQNATNVPQNCPSSRSYQPPLPYDVTVDGVFYAQLERSDVDCTADVWAAKDGCTFEFCDRLDSAEVTVKILYIRS